MNRTGVMGSLDAPRPTHRQDAVLLYSRAGWSRAGMIFIGLGILALIASGFVDSEDWWMHGAWCIAAGAAVVPVALKAFRAGVAVMLRDHLAMFACAFGLYYVFGAALLAFGPEQQVAYVLSAYPTDAPAALRADAVNGIGFGIALLAGALLPRRFFARQADKVAFQASKVPLVAATLIIACVGVLASAYAISTDLGGGGVVSGTVRSLGQFSLVAIFLGSSHRGRWEGPLRFLAIVMAVALAASGFLLFSKTGMLLPLVALLAGLSVRYHSRKVLVVGLVSLGLLFVATAGVTSYGRITVDKAYGDELESRLTVIEEGFTEDRADSSLTEYAGWARLCYTTVQVAAMDLYDSSMGGDELGLIPWVFVPRILVPDKPSITQSGVELSIKISGSSTTSTGQGIFSSGYYNLGWIGLLLASVICGWILAQTSAIANAIVSRQAALLLPFALLGVLIAFRIDGHFIADYIGAFVFILYPILGAAFVLSIRRGRL